MNQPCKDGKRTRNPHECKHLRPDSRTDIQLRNAPDNVAEDYEHDGRDDGGGGRKECGEEGEDGDGDGGPAGVDGERAQEDKEGREAGRGQEEAKHDLGGEFDQVEDVVDVGGKVDCSKHCISGWTMPSRMTGQKE